MEEETGVFLRNQEIAVREVKRIIAPNVFVNVRGFFCFMRNKKNLSENLIPQDAEVFRRKKK